MTKNIKIAKAENLQYIASSYGWSENMTIYRPIIAKDSGFHLLGDYFQKTKKNEEIIDDIYIISDPSEENTAYPIDFELVWSSLEADKSTIEKVTFWKPIAPIGFVALGSIVNIGFEKPKTDIMKCIKIELLESSKPILSFTDRGSGSKNNMQIFTSKSNNKINPGTFTIVQHSNMSTVIPKEIHLYSLATDNILIVVEPLELIVI
jgi:hypothetical protein